MSTARPLVTVLTAVRDGGRYLGDAIDSIRCQTASDWEYVLVDDASDDDSSAIAQRFADEDPRIRVVRRAVPGGPYVAANDGLDLSRGKYIARMDADDIALPNRLERQLAFLRSAPDLRATGSFSRALFSDGKLRDRIATVPTSPGVLKWWLTAAGGPVHSSLMIERSAIEALGGYRPLPLAADRWLWCDLSRRGWLGVVPEVLVHRRRHPDQLGSTATGPQLELALEGAQHHLEQLTSRGWSREEGLDLYRLAHRITVRRAPGLRVLTRWTSHWIRDRGLVAGERRQLASLTRKWLRRVLASGS